MTPVERWIMKMIIRYLIRQQRKARLAHEREQSVGTYQTLKHSAVSRNRRYTREQREQGIV